jgi:hypothetical protein
VIASLEFATQANRDAARDDLVQYLANKTTISKEITSLDSPLGKQGIFLLVADVEFDLGRRVDAGDLRARIKQRLQTAQVRHGRIMIHTCTHEETTKEDCSTKEFEYDEK